MRKIELQIAGLTNTLTQSQSYAVLLNEVDGNRNLPIVIGAFRAQAIAVALENVTINRPLSHDLIKNIFGVFEIKLLEVLINNLQDGIFYAKLVCESEGNMVEIDSRTSDAIALAVRFKCPIYVYEFIMDAAGTISHSEEEITDEPEVENEEALKEEQYKSPLKDISILNLQELKEKLQETLDKENYELAARIRDEIEKRRRKK